jgi:hypothetical protein
MPPIEEYLKRAPELAQEVVNIWGRAFEAANAALRAQGGHFFQPDALFSDDFKAVLYKAFPYLDAKSRADNDRHLNRLSQRNAAEETATRQAFAEAYMIFCEKNRPAA